MNARAWKYASVVRDDMKSFFGSRRGEVLVDFCHERVRHNAEEHPGRLRLVASVHARQARGIVRRDVVKQVIRARSVEDRSHPGPAPRNVVGAQIKDDMVAKTEQLHDVWHEGASEPSRGLQIVVQGDDGIGKLRKPLVLANNDCRQLASELSGQRRFAGARFTADEVERCHLKTIAHSRRVPSCRSARCHHCERHAGETARCGPDCN
jgi:hypothetical protein